MLKFIIKCLFPSHQSANIHCCLINNQTSQKAISIPSKKLLKYYFQQKKMSNVNMIFGNDQYHATAAAINLQKREKKSKRKIIEKNVKLIIINGKYRFFDVAKGHWNIGNN